jgi:hypothetical protein
MDRHEAPILWFSLQYSPLQLMAKLSPSLSVPALKCQLYLRTHHDARACWKLAKPEFVRKLEEDNARLVNSKGYFINFRFLVAHRTL